MRISDWISDVCSSDLDPVEALVQLAVVLYADLHRQPGAQLARERGLLLRDGDAHATDAVALRRELQRLAPAAADVEHAHPLAQPELAADQVELGFLRIIEVLRLAPVAARSEEHTSELQSLMRTSFAVFCLKTKIKNSS